MEKRTTTITRSWGATVGYVIGGLAALGLSVVLFVTIAEGSVTVGIALIPGIVGLTLLYVSLGGAGRAPAPFAPRRSRPRALRSAGCREKL